ncbi:hypothetical protein SADUNF_Sadunf19G0060300 [Salix dunnii]|uniref:Uncharacterized protein n=1 Tax=Salix dunnii TaxID=1413687 RepID=A0A835J3H7_9ROSI|nr:hypothetical protein SADUNF_Sadunf19G0060300 [Salix dunnii]
MVHGILQFTKYSHFARSSSRSRARDIRCESFRLSQKARPEQDYGVLCTPFPWRFSPRGLDWRAVVGVPDGVLRSWTAAGGCPEPGLSCHGFAGVSTMILPQVHLRKPCYDFSFL